MLYTLQQSNRRRKFRCRALESLSVVAVAAASRVILAYTCKNLMPEVIGYARCEMCQGQGVRSDGKTCSACGGSGRLALFDRPDGDTE